MRHKAKAKDSMLKAKAFKNYLFKAKDTVKNSESTMIPVEESITKQPNNLAQSI